MRNYTKSGKRVSEMEKFLDVFISYLINIVTCRNSHQRSYSFLLLLRGFDDTSFCRLRCLARYRQYVITVGNTVTCSCTAHYGYKCANCWEKQVSHCRHQLPWCFFLFCLPSCSVYMSCYYYLTWDPPFSTAHTLCKWYGHWISFALVLIMPLYR